MTCGGVPWSQQGVTSQRTCSCLAKETGVERMRCGAIIRRPSPRSLRALPRGNLAGGARWIHPPALHKFTPCALHVTSTRYIYAKFPIKLIVGIQRISYVFSSLNARRFFIRRHSTYIAVTLRRDCKRRVKHYQDSAWLRLDINWTGLRLPMLNTTLVILPLAGRWIPE